VVSHLVLTTTPHSVGVVRIRTDRGRLGRYVEVVVSLTGYGNHEATLTLTSHDDGHATSYAFIDDAATS
jgi:hypothetical protein